MTLLGNRRHRWYLENPFKEAMNAFKIAISGHFA